MGQTKLMSLVQFILEERLRVFKRRHLQDKLPAPLKALGYQSISNIIGKLVKNNWLTPLGEGIYTVAHISPVHEYEIAMLLAEPSMISHRSAFFYHNLSDQIIKNVYLTTLNTIYVPQQDSAGKNNKKTYIVIKGIEYDFICIKKEKFFGAEAAWIGENKFKVSNIERTLLDGLSHPQYCGGLQEVIYAFQEAAAKLDLNQIIDYSLRLDTAVSRRLGWVLDNILHIPISKIAILKKQAKDYRLLDASSPARGKYDVKWGLRLNHHY